MSTTWTANAACRDANPDLFFPDQGCRGWGKAAIERFCQTCPVQAECLDEALEHKLNGVWGGTTDEQRRALTRAPLDRPRTIPVPSARFLADRLGISLRSAFRLRSTLLGEKQT